MKETKSLAVIYEDAEARQAAVAFCDCLIKRFWDEFDFDVSWWQFDALESSDTAREAARKASGADFVVFGSRSGEAIPSRSLTNWVELWLETRGQHEGALVSLPSPQAASGFETTAFSLYLRAVAHRAGMDYISDIPQGLAHPIPESPDSCTKRAEEVGSVLDEILHASHPRAGLPLS
jgi:hypothetical protein